MVLVRKRVGGYNMQFGHGLLRTGTWLHTARQTGCAATARQPPLSPSYLPYPD